MFHVHVCGLQVSLVFPVTFFIVCGFLVVFPAYTSPELVGVDVAILVVGVIVYLVCIQWKSKPKFLLRFTSESVRGFKSGVAS